MLGNDKLAKIAKQKQKESNKQDEYEALQSFLRSISSTATLPPYVKGETYSSVRGVFNQVCSQYYLIQPLIFNLFNLLSNYEFDTKLLKQWQVVPRIPGTITLKINIEKKYFHIWCTATSIWPHTEEDYSDCWLSHSDALDLRREFGSKSSIVFWEIFKGSHLEPLRSSIYYILACP